MEDDSFDPRSWLKNAPNSSNAKADLNGANGPDASALPEMWRGLGADTANDIKTPIPQNEETDRSPRSRLLAMASSASLLVSGAAGAWFTQLPPVPLDLQGAMAPAEMADPAMQLVDRTFSLSNAREIVPAMVAVGVAEEEALAVARSALAGISTSGEVKARISLRPDGDGFIVQRFQASYLDGSGAVVSRLADGSFSSQVIAAELTSQVKVLSGELDSTSFYTSAVAAGITDTLIPEFINAFSYDFNLASEISPGDTFEVAFQQSVNAEGQAVGQPHLLFAQLTTPQKSRALYRFETSDGEAGWYDGNGASTKRGLMRTPVDGARISSKFGMRFHPVLNYNRLHGGVDLAAPTGTPIYAAADGVVSFAAMKGPNGNLTVLQHENGMRTMYLHQNRFMPGIAAGASVKQGQHIGDIGTTGRSTGPHLHYEVHIDGTKVDPLSIQTDDSKRKRIEGAAINAFMRERDRVDLARAQQAY